MPCQTHPGRFEEKELQVEPEAGAEEGVVAQDRNGEAEREERLVDHGHHVVGVPQDPVVDVQRGQLLLVNTHHVLSLGRHQLLLHLEPGHGLYREERED